MTNPFRPQGRLDSLRSPGLVFGEGVSEAQGFANSTGSYTLRLNILSTAATERFEKGSRVTDEIAKPTAPAGIIPLPIFVRPFDDAQLSAARSVDDLIAMGNSELGDEGSVLDFRSGELDSQVLNLDLGSLASGSDSTDDFAFDGADLFTVFELGRFEQQLASAEMTSADLSADGLAMRGPEAGSASNWFSGLSRQKDRLYRTIDEMFASLLAVVPAQRFWQSLQQSQPDSSATPTRQGPSSDDKSRPRARQALEVRNSPASNATEKRTVRRTTAKNEPHRPVHNDQPTRATVDVRPARDFERQLSN
jgi:hypothetical protein